MFLSVYRNESRLRNSQDDHLDLIVYAFFDAMSGAEPHQVGVQVAAHIQGPDHSGAIVCSRGYGFVRFTEFFGLAEPPFPTSPRHVQEADGITEGLD